MTTTDTALAQDIGLARETDYFLMTDQLTEDELGLLYQVRKFAETEVLPVVNAYWERGEFPFELVPKLAELNIVGDTMVATAPRRCRPSARDCWLMSSAG